MRTTKLAHTCLPTSSRASCRSALAALVCVAGFSSPAWAGDAFIPKSRIFSSVPHRYEGHPESGNLVPYYDFVVDEVAGDFDGDGRADVAFFQARDNRLTVRVHRSLGTVLDTQLAVDQALGLYHFPSQLWRSGDVDGDGKDELILLFGRPVVGATAAIYELAGDQFVRTGFQSLAAPYSSDQRWDLGDLNGDGMEDLLLVHNRSTTGATAVYYRSTGGSFRKTSVQRLGTVLTGDQRWKLGDVDGDGKADLVLIFGHPLDGATAWVFRFNGSVFRRVSTERLNLVFDASQVWSVGDADGDGRADLVVVYGPFGAVAVTYLSVGTSFALDRVEVLGHRFENDHNTVQRWLSGDADADGDQDLILIDAECTIT